MFSDDVAAQPGLLQRIDPRVKLVTLLGLLVAAALVRNIPVLVGAVRGDARARRRVAALARRSSSSGCGCSSRSSPASSCCRRRSTSSPPATIVVPLGTWFGHPVGLTSQGLHGAGADRHPGRGVDLARRAAHAHDAVDTGCSPRCGRCSCRGCSSSCSGMAYRYLFHLLGSVTDMYTARKAAHGRRRRRRGVGPAFVAASAGALFGKAHALSEEVHLAMVAARLHRQRPHARRPSRLAARRRRVWSSAASLLGVVVLGARSRPCPADPCTGPLLVLRRRLHYAYLEPVPRARRRVAHGRARARRSRCSAPTAAASRRC